jgi:ubiquinone/menaquinone biosynthesis C-methylase UbiE
MSALGQQLKWKQKFRHWLKRATDAEPNIAQTDPHTAGLPEFKAYVESIDRFNTSQPNGELLDNIRSYNHQIIGEFNKIRPLAGMALLDIGASPHGYAMEKCFAFDVHRYMGIGLDIDAAEDVRFGDAEGSLRYMNAQDLAFADGSFDLVVSMSTFEHIADVPKALAEIHRVLRPGGAVLLSFEPLWTCAYGHHLHHFGPVSHMVPDWAHLLWDREQMRAYLEDKWPDDAPLDLDRTIEWIYDNEVINRIGITQMREHFEQCPLRVEWILPMKHEGSDSAMLAQAMATTGLSTVDLSSKGLSVLLYKDVC